MNHETTDGTSDDAESDLRSPVRNLLNHFVLSVISKCSGGQVFTVEFWGTMKREVSGGGTGATIEFLNGAQLAAGKATADANGYYRVELPPGEYLYRVRAEGYRTEDAGRGLRLTVSSGFAIFNPALVKGADVAEPKPVRPR